jgi:hypothetical protein
MSSAARSKYIIAGWQVIESANDYIQHNYTCQVIRLPALLQVLHVVYLCIHPKMRRVPLAHTSKYTIDVLYIIIGNNCL